MRDRGVMEVELGGSLPQKHKQASKQSRNQGVIAADKRRDWAGSRCREEEQRARNCPSRPKMHTALYPISLWR